jgi:hypothetical protein
VIVMQDNGELQEDVVPAARLEGGWLDAELRDSFPASDPLSHWAGPPRPLDDADRTLRWVVHRHAVDQAPGSDPGAPLPPTLPRNVSSG